MPCKLWTVHSSKVSTHAHFGVGQSKEIREDVDNSRRKKNAYVGSVLPLPALRSDMYCTPEGEEAAQVGVQCVTSGLIWRRGDPLIALIAWQRCSASSERTNNQGHEKRRAHTSCTRTHTRYAETLFAYVPGCLASVCFTWNDRKLWSFVPAFGASYTNLGPSPLFEPNAWVRYAHTHAHTFAFCRDTLIRCISNSAIADHC